MTMMILELLELLERLESVSRVFGRVEKKERDEHLPGDEEEASKLKKILFRQHIIHFCCSFIVSILFPV